MGEKVYSRADLLGKYYEEGVKNTGFMGRLKHRLNQERFQQYSFHIPRTVFLRGQQFCVYIEDMSETTFDHNTLINTLYHEFIMMTYQTLDLKIIYKHLLNMRLGAGSVMQFVKQDPWNATFTVKPGIQKQNMEKLYVSFRQKYALVLETLLEDLETLYPDHGFIFEDVLAYMYCDFINSYNKGNRKQLVKQIIKTIDSDEE